MKKIFATSLILITLLVIGCRNDKPSTTVDNCQKLQVKSDIEALLRDITDCTKRKDINGFMASCDDTFILESNETADSNRTIAKDTLKADILQSWGIITKIYQVENWVDSISVPASDTAIVFTNQFFHRTFSRPNNLPGEDDIITTQKHRETWIKRPNGWKQSRIKELGGFIYVNGKPYSPK